MVRQGEIKSPEEAAQIRPNAGTTGTMPPDLSALQSGDGHDSPLELEQDMGIEIERQPIEVNDAPLDALEPPAELVKPRGEAPSVLVPPAAANR